jgi:hypothetical protein
MVDDQNPGHDSICRPPFLDRIGREKPVERQYINRFILKVNGIAIDNSRRLDYRSDDDPIKGGQRG